MASRFYECCKDEMNYYFLSTVAEQKVQDCFWTKLAILPEDDDEVTVLIKKTLGVEKGKEIIEKVNNKIFKQLWQNKRATFLKLDNYMENVTGFYQVQPFFYDKTGLFWFWIENRWQIVDEIDVMNGIEESLSFHGATIKGNIKSAYLEAFKRYGRKKIPKEAPNTWIQFQDCIVDVVKNITMPITNEYFLTNPIPYKLGKSTKTPTIDRLFKSWVKPEDVLKLNEIASYCLLPSYPIHRMFYFLGCGSNGKSKYLEFIERLISKDNFCTSELDLLSENRFESSKLYRKLVCMMGETNFTSMKKTSMLKKLSAGDNITIEFKNKNPFDAKNFAKLLISSNSLPTTLDKTKGWYRRFCYVDFPNEFLEGKNPVDSIPAKEYENFCLKSLVTLNNLLNNYKFTNEQAIEERAKEYEERSNPLLKFLNERTEKKIDGNIFVFEFTEKFEKYCKEHGFRIWTARQISAEMKEKNYESERIWNPNKQTTWWSWIGLSWIKKEKTLTVTTDITYPNSIRKLSNEVVSRNIVSCVSCDSSLIHHNCSICGITPCYGWDAKGTKPLCQNCLDQEEMVEDVK